MLPTYSNGYGSSVFNDPKFRNLKGLRKPKHHWTESGNVASHTTNGVQYYYYYTTTTTRSNTTTTTIILYYYILHTYILFLLLLYYYRLLLKFLFLIRTRISRLISFAIDIVRFSRRRRCSSRVRQQARDWNRNASRCRRRRVTCILAAAAVVPTLKVSRRLHEWSSFTLLPLSYNARISLHA